MGHRAFISGIVGMAIMLGSSIALPQQRQIGGVGLTVFTDLDFRGQSATLRNNTPDLRRIGMNDAVQSLQVAPGEQWEVCEHINYQGRCVVVSGSEADLRQSGWDRTISSARRISGSSGPRPPVQPIPGGIELFSRTGFSGDRRAFRDQQSDLRRVGFNDMARSLRISPREVWEVCADAGFRNCLVVNTDWQDLRGLGMSRSISSVRPWQQGGGRGGSQPSILLYDDRGFRGRSVRVDRESSSLSGFANRAESVQVLGGTWELCDGSRFSGRCVVVSTNISDLSSVGLRNRVVSVRPVRGPR